MLPLRAEIVYGKTLPKKCLSQADDQMLDLTDYPVYIHPTCRPNQFPIDQTPLSWFEIVVFHVISCLSKIDPSKSGLCSA